MRGAILPLSIRLHGIGHVVMLWYLVEHKDNSTIQAIIVIYLHTYKLLAFTSCITCSHGVHLCP
jgi:hypothetical protein